jgi:hypothetical protein
MRLKLTSACRQTIAAVALAAAALSGGPADARQAWGKFGVSVVHGVKVVAVAKGQSRDVWSDPRFFPETCAHLNANRQLMQEAAAQVIEQKFDQQLPHGFSVSRVKVTLQPIDCENSGRMPGVATIGFDYRFARSNLTFSLNTTQDGVPRMDFSASFDLDVRANLILPQTAPLTLGLEKPHLDVQNISYDSENTAADIVKGAVDALHALTGFDATSSVTQDRAIDFDSVKADIGRLQNALPAGSSLQVTRQNDLAILTVGDGSSVGDAHCISGYVWRQAGPGDLVCVTPAVRAQTAADNREWHNRVVQTSVSPCATYLCRMQSVHPTVLATAPQKLPCRTGYVYREAYADDYVCVTPATHAQALSDNQYELVRRVDYKPAIK